MKHPLLNQNNIFVLDATDFLPPHLSGFNIVYAPLANVLFVAEDEIVHKLEQGYLLPEDSLPTEIAGTVKVLKNRDPQPGLQYVNPDLTDVSVLYILPNYKCNFSCSYCYAAKGRSDKEMSVENLGRAIAFFLNAEVRNERRPRRIVFMGGGEPMLSWPLIENGVALAEKIAEGKGLKILFSIITNGSILTEEKLAFIRSHDIRMNVSFEILKEIQELQRGNFDVVASNIKKLLKNDIKVVIRSTVTPDNVGLLEKMVEEVWRNYSGITALNLEPVTDSKLDSVSAMSEFLNEYRKNFIAALESGRDHGLKIVNSVILAMGQVHRAHCAGSISVNPEGGITACPCFSSPEEKGYSENLIGKIQADAPVLDRRAYDRILPPDITESERCRRCYAKYVCAGGCIHNNLTYGSAVRDIICDHTREMLRTFLFARAERQYRQLTGKDLISALSETRGGGRS